MQRVLGQRGLLLAGSALLGVVAAVWLAGGPGPIAAWLAEAQKAAQDRLAEAIRAMRSGAPGALIGLWTICLAYGVLHAAGPGHGKLLIGGYGMARRVPLTRLAGLALGASLMQALVAVALVYALVGVLGLKRAAVEEGADRWMTPAGHILIAGLGLWLMWRGLAGVLRAYARPVPLPAPAKAHDHAHDHDHDHTHAHADTDHAAHVHGPQCRHAHAPTLEEVARVTSWRDALLLVAGIAIRPCSGALFVLVVTWQLGIGLAGIAGVLVMGLGTGLVTVAVAVLAVWSREGALSGLAWGLDSGAIARLVPLLELVIGALIAMAAFGLLLRAL